MNVSISESISKNGSANIGNEDMEASIGGSVGIDIGAEIHVEADKSGISMEAEYHEVAQASATASGTAEKEGVGISGTGTVYAKIGTEIEGYMDAGKHGVDVGAGASIGDAVRIDAEITESARYVSGTAGAGVNIGEHFEAGGSAQATYDKGIVTVGVAGDVAALIGLDIDVSASIDTNQIVKDGKEVVHIAEKVAPVITSTTNKAVNTVESTTNKAVNTVTNTAKSTVNTISNGAKKLFKKIRI